MTSKKFKAIRTLLGLTQVAMAAALQTPLRTLQDWEYGRRRIPGIAEVAVKCMFADWIPIKKTTGMEGRMSDMARQR